MHSRNRALRHADAAQRACQARDRATHDALEHLRQRDRHRMRAAEIEAGAEERAAARGAGAWELGAAAEREARMGAQLAARLAKAGAAAAKAVRALVLYPISAPG